MKKLLPVAYPPITSYPVIANILSILWTKKDEVLPWICDHFIQIMVRVNHELAYFGHIRTLIPGTSGQHNGNIRTA